MKKKVLLVYAGPKTNLPRLPMSSITLASYLRKFGYDCKVLDLRVDKISDLNFNEYLAVGISSMSGPSLKAALSFARKIREKTPKLPIIWGGAHVSFFPEQSIQSTYIDAVVVGEGEETLKEILDRITKKKNYDDLAGTVVLKDGKPFRNVNRPFIDLDTLEIPAYDLIDIKKYSDNYAYFSYESSRGCPHRCAFCYIHIFHNRRWRAKSAKKVLAELAEIEKKYHPKKIDFVEDNLFVDRKRLREIAQGKIDMKLKFRWMGFCRADYLAGYSDEFMDLIGRSGCEVLSIGVESGANTMLKKITKDITPQQVITSAKKCIRYKIMPVMSFIIGTPGETKKEMHESLDLCRRLYKFGNRMEVNGIFVYSPYPGTPIYEKAIKLGYVPYESIEEWANWHYTDIDNTPWLSKSYKKQLETISLISRFKFFSHRLSLYPKKYIQSKLKNKFNLILYRVIYPLLNLDAEIRFSLKIFLFAPEWRLYSKYTESRFDKR